VAGNSVKKASSSRPEVSGGPDRDETEFDRLYRTHFSAMYAYVARRRPSHEVPDLVAEVFATAWRRLDAVPPPSEDRLWLYGVARRVLSQDGRTTFRRRALVNRLAQNRPSHEQSDVDEPDWMADLRELIAHLKPLDREVVRLVAWEALSHEEVAHVLGCTANAVAIRWHRAISQLRRQLSPQILQDIDGIPTQPREEDTGGN
jgi:RNA polymerase sigma factor (sigma-70 family)